jgi:uncharacterized protein (DUF1330 family)
MPKAYVIVDIDVTDPAAYDRYKVLAAPAVAQFGGSYIVRGGATEVLEGDRVPNRTVLIEFPDVDAARNWYHSPEYAAAREERAGAATGSLILAEGV